MLCLKLRCEAKKKNIIRGSYSFGFIITKQRLRENIIQILTLSTGIIEI